MTKQRDIKRTLDQWFADGPSVASDRVLDAVADRIERQPQRPAWRLLWRETHMNTIFRAGAVLAAIVIVAVVGLNMLPRSSSGIGSTPAMQSPSVIPSASPSASTISCEDDLPGCAGPLLAGEHRSTGFAPKIIYTTPSGWTNSIDTETIFKLDPPDASDPYILVWTNVHIAEQTATCDPIPKAGAGDPVEDWIDFLTSHPGLDTTDPAPVDFPGGQDEKGQTIDVSVAADWTTVCPTHTGPYVMLIANNDGIEYGVPSDQRLQLTLLEVRGQTVVIEVYGPKSPELFASAVAVTQPLIDSFKFGCGPSVPRPCGVP